MNRLCPFPLLLAVLAAGASAETPGRQPRSLVETLPVPAELLQQYSGPGSEAQKPPARAQGRKETPEAEPEPGRSEPTETGTWQAPSDARQEDSAAGGGFAGQPASTPGFAPPRSLGSAGFLSGALPNPPTLPAAGKKGDSRDIEPGEILIASGDLATARAVAQAMNGAGYRLLRRKVLGGLGMVLSVFRVPEGQDVLQVVEALRAQSPDVWLDANHRYLPQGTPVRYARDLIGWKSTPGCGRGLVLGLADGPLDADHPAFRGRRIRSYDLVGVRWKPAPADHGTAIAGLLVGAPGSGFDGLLPEAELHLAVVLREAGKHRVDTTAEKLVAALDRFASQRVQVALLSLGGPPNRLVELAVLLARQRGMSLVAAAGNGERKGPVYPAAYEGVVGVTAVDARKRPMPNASHGNHVDLAAPGVDLWTAAPGGGGRYRSGTSYAAPIVAAALALEGAGSEQNLFRRAEDLGVPGRDPVFGHGLLRYNGCGGEGIP